ncbi:MAG: hypothetical protein FWG10_11410 [Eubacteriaceae bacterium]|nr:hypothetical protein [Eubacteriaceae bacterium]
MLGNIGKRSGFSKSISLSEAMAIAVMLHHSHYRKFKHYYLDLVKGGWASYFRWLPSYNRFLELMKEVAVPLYIFVATSTLAECAGISFIGSTTIYVCSRPQGKTEQSF